MPVTTPTAYSEIKNLLIGDLLVSEQVDRQKFVDDAADEIDSKLGWVYVTPIVTSGLPRHEGLLLKSINNRLASGRLILTLNISEEGTSLHAYGLRLINEAMADLLLIANGEVDLSAPKIDTPSRNRGNQPTIITRDLRSPVEAFEDRFMTVWPGAAALESWEPGA